ncbi:hypothetical protein MPSEU_000638200 [Mayamaea pseudoterrestris]|nr:hypothetical protein MPSEU_000638200 [Mayamaea pseudoterrestris]
MRVASLLPTTTTRSMLVGMRDMSTAKLRTLRSLSSYPSRLYSTSSPLSESHKQRNALVSSRGASVVGRLPTYLADARAVESYSKETPNGALQLGVAESLLLEDWLLPMLNVQPQLEIPADCIYYQQTMGRLATREAFADYMKEVLNLSYTPDPDNIVLGSGCNAVLENLCMVLADVGDAILIPTPYYAAFEFDVGARAGLIVEPVITGGAERVKEMKNRFARVDKLDATMYYPTTQSLEAAYQQCLQADRAPRILLLSHPHNPLGICYPAAVVNECIDWAVSKEIHVISDEIYAGSIYKPDDAQFVSALELCNDGSGNVGPFVHWVYSLSKDFCSSGLRVGVSYTCNDKIRLPLQKLNDLCQLPSTTQVWTQHMLTARAKGESWTTAFRRENHERLKARCDALTQVLRKIGVPYLPATAGLFLWIDFSRFLPHEGTAAERERALYMEMVKEHGLLFTPGWSMRNDKPGFFRCVFTAATDEEFAMALQRLRKFAESKKQ